MMDNDKQPSYESASYTIMESDKLEMKEANFETRARSPHSMNIESPKLKAHLKFQQERGRGLSKQGTLEGSDASFMTKGSIQSALVSARKTIGGHGDNDYFSDVFSDSDDGVVLNTSNTVTPIGDLDDEKVIYYMFHHVLFLPHYLF